MTSDIDLIEGVWIFHFRPNLIRPSLKTASSKRVVPAHQDLVSPGFIAQAAAWDEWGPGEREEKTGAGKMGGGAALFSDLTREHANAGLGESIAFRFDRILDDTLGTDRGPKSFHSFRHYVTDHLRRSNVAKEIRLDILGHSGSDFEDEVCGSTSLPRDMKAAVDLLPPVVP